MPIITAFVKRELWLGGLIKLLPRLPERTASLIMRHLVNTLSWHRWLCEFAKFGRCGALCYPKYAYSTSFGRWRQMRRKVNGPTWYLSWTSLLEPRWIGWPTYGGS